MPRPYCVFDGNVFDPTVFHTCPTEGGGFTRFDEQDEFVEEFANYQKRLPVVYDVSIPELFFINVEGSFSFFHSVSVPIEADYVGQLSFGFPVEFDHHGVLNNDIRVLFDVEKEFVSERFVDFDPARNVSMNFLIDFSVEKMYSRDLQVQYFVEIPKEQLGVNVLEILSAIDHVSMIDDEI